MDELFRASLIRSSLTQSEIGWPLRLNSILNDKYFMVSTFTHYLAQVGAAIWIRLYSACRLCGNGSAKKSTMFYTECES